MDYKTIEDTLGPYLDDNLAGIEKTRKAIGKIEPEDAFDKKALSVFNSILKNIEINESFKRIARNIISNADYFSDKNIHQTTKSEYLKQLLSDNNYVENNKSFSLSILQTYVENILNKQLYEINIKIEENQRILHNMDSSASGRYSRNTRKPRHAKYLFVENEGAKYAVRYTGILEILKFGKAVSPKHLGTETILYNKVIGINRRNVVKKTDETRLDKNQLLRNKNSSLNNTTDKYFAVITRNRKDYYIFFVDNVLYTDPVEAEDKGEYAGTFEGDYRTIEV
ncbi:MAG: hypothetical protein R6V41_07660 [Desulfobacteraceae bacterium]